MTSLVPYANYAHAGKLNNQKYSFKGKSDSIFLIMSQAIADPSVQEPAIGSSHQAMNADADNANLDLRELGIPSELMTDLPVDDAPSSRQAMEVDTISQPQPENAPVPQAQPPSQATPVPQAPPFPQNQTPNPQNQIPPQQGLPINPQGQPQQNQQPAPLQPPVPAPPNPDNLANNYRVSAKGDPVKQMALTLLKENPALSLVEADSKAKERLGLTATPEELSLEEQIKAIEAEADRATEDMDVSTARKLDKEVAAKKAQLEQQRQQRESTARQQIEFEELEIEAQDSVGQRYPDAFVPNSAMSQAMFAINQAMINGNDPRINDPRLIEVIAEQAAAQLRAQGMQPGWTHYANQPPAPQTPQPPQYQQAPQYPPPPAPPTAPIYAPPQQQQPVYQQPYQAAYPQQQQPYAQPYAQPPQYQQIPVPTQQQSPYQQPPIASGAAGRQAQASGSEKAFLERLAKVQSGGLDDYESFVEDYANGKI